MQSPIETQLGTPFVPFASVSIFSTSGFSCFLQENQCFFFFDGAGNVFTSHCIAFRTCKNPKLKNLSDWSDSSLYKFYFVTCQTTFAKIFDYSVPKFSGESMYCTAMCLIYFSQLIVFIIYRRIFNLFIYFLCQQTLECCLSLYSKMLLHMHVLFPFFSFCSFIVCCM